MLTAPESPVDLVALPRHGAATRPAAAFSAIVRATRAGASYMRDGAVIYPARFWSLRPVPPP